MRRRFRRRKLPDSSVRQRRRTANTGGLPDFLPGRLVLAPGSLRDYDALASFHYLHGRPATVAAVWTVRYVPPPDVARASRPRARAQRPGKAERVPRLAARAASARARCPRHDGARRNARATTPGSRLVAAAVLSYPVPSCLPRRAALHIRGKRRAELRFANRHLRTISRVVVHPQFRALGLSGALIRRLLQDCDTRYVEALAVMAEAHPMFKRVGKQRIPVACSSKTRRRHRPPAYFIIDRHARGRDSFGCRTSALTPSPGTPGEGGGGGQAARRARTGPHPNPPTHHEYAVTSAYRGRAKRLSAVTTSATSRSRRPRTTSSRNFKGG